LYKFGERYYDPLVGRWTQKDPKGGGYVYANNLPNMLVDPSGLLVGNCGDAELVITPGELPGTSTFDWTLFSDWGDIVSYVGFITIYDQSNLFPFPTQLVIGGNPNSTYGYGNLLNYETGSGALAASIVGIAVLKDGTTCAFGARFVRG